MPGGYLCSQAHPDRSGVEAAQREIQTTAGNITLVAQQSTAAVNRTVHSVTNVLLVVVPAMILLVALAAWYFTGRALRPVEAIRREAEVDHRRHHAPAGARSPTPTTRSGAWPAR